jgi:hypothetical protein
MSRGYILKKHVASLSDLVDGNASLGALMACGGKWYYCDPNNGTAGGDARTPQTATNSLLTAYNMTRSGYHDGVIFIAGSSAWAPAATLAWSNSYCHLIGIGSELPGLGQRCRVVAAAAVMHDPVITFSGAGCVVKNMQFGNEHATASACGVIAITNSRNLFENCFFMVPFSATAASYSLKLSGAENVFRNCTIGQMTCPRTAATHGLWILQTGGTGANPTRNKFLHCEFLSWCSVAGHAHITIATDVDVEAFTLFLEDCLFLNINGGANLAHAIIDGATNVYHRIILRGDCMFEGNDSGIADPVTYTYSNISAPAAPATAVVAAH